MSKKEDKKNSQKGDESFEDSEAQTCCKNLKNYPKHIGFIIGNEFCERFSYYGMRSVLLLYLRNYLKWDDDTSTSVYHAFTVLAYFFPVLGGIIADSYWGKYKTIVILSIVYVFGHVLKTIGSIPYVPSQLAHKILSMFGLVFIAAGTGGIKPCVSSFGGDQFTSDQSYLRKQFFSLFYFAINAGSLISTFITPIFRADVNCYPNETGEEFEECFALAFGIPGALMVVALILFVAGSRWYTIHPAEGSVFVRMCKCIYSAIKKRWKTPKSERTKLHWIDYAEASDKMKRDTKYVLQIILLFLPIPAFWALFDQQGSRWTLQAIQLDGRLGAINLKPDQIEVFNPLLILILIPLMEFTLYPLLEYFKINFSALRKMTMGFVLTGISFIIAAILQINIDKNLTVLPTSSQFGVRLINSASCNLNITLQNEIPIFMEKNLASEIIFFPKNTKVAFSYSTCSGKQLNDVIEAGAETVRDIFLHGVDAEKKVELNMITKKTEDGGGRFSILNLAASEKNLTYKITDVETKVLPYETRTKYLDVARGNIAVSVLDGITELYEIEFEIEVGAVYTLIITDFKDESFYTQDLNPNVIGVAWIIPQFIIISIGEVFLSITGLEFSYSQAPPSMKSVLASIWLLTVSFGNVIVLIVAEARGIEKQSNEFFLFAGLVFLAGIVFAWLAYRYKLVDEDEFAEEFEEKLGVENTDFDNNDEKQTTKL